MDLKAERDPIAFKELKDSVDLRGFSTPVAVRKTRDGAELELIFGYGRRAVGRELNKELPAILYDVDDVTALAMAVDENMCRENMTVLDEIGFALFYVSQFDGDVHMAAKSLGWEVSKVRSRIQLTRCTDKVKEALGSKKIDAAHATYLSVLEENIQNNTLVKIIAEKWTPNTLKAKLGKVQNRINTATFDTQECNLCPHNSDGIQSDIFAVSTGVQSGMCNNSHCFQAKTKQALEAIKNELEERIGNVIFITESVKERNKVSTQVVGEKQYKEGCINCENRCAVIDDRVGYHGKVTTDQCLDAECFDSIVDEIKKAKQETAVQLSDTKAVAESVSIEVTTNEKPVTSSKAQASPMVTDATAKVKSKLTQPLKEHIRNRSRQMVSDFLVNNETVVEAIKLAALGKLACDHQSNESDISKSIDLDLDKIRSKQDELVLKYIKETPRAERYVLETYRAFDVTQTELKNNWSPTKELLKLYRKDGLIKLAECAGFDKWFNEQGQNKDFNKLSKAKMDIIIEELMNPDFSWTDFIPSEFLTIKTA